jgi:F0F1-type ATP synthase assembly protein I
MERWKLTLAWGSLVIFFVLPIVLMMIHLWLGHSTDFAKEFRYVGEYLRTVAAIIISLAGFNTVEIFKQK